MMFIVPKGAVIAGTNLSKFRVFNLCLKLNETGGAVFCLLFVFLPFGGFAVT